MPRPLLPWQDLIDRATWLFQSLFARPPAPSNTRLDRLLDRTLEEHALQHISILQKINRSVTASFAMLRGELCGWEGWWVGAQAESCGCVGGWVGARTESRGCVSGWEQGLSHVGEWLGGWEQGLSQARLESWGLKEGMLSRGRDSVAVFWVGGGLGWGV